MKKYGCGSFAEYLRSSDFHERHLPLGTGVFGGILSVFGPTKLIRACGLLIGAAGLSMYQPHRGVDGPTIHYEEEEFDGSNCDEVDEEVFKEEVTE